MSRKNHNYRAWAHQNPRGTTYEAWNAAWKSQQGKAYSLKIESLKDRVTELESEVALWELGASNLELALVAEKKENAALVDAAREYSYNEHFPDCKIHRPSIKVCTCGYAELSTLLQSEGEI